MPLISTAARISTRDDTGQLGHATIEGQLELYNQSLYDMKNRTSEAGHMLSLFDAVWAKITHTGSDLTVMTIFENSPPPPPQFKIVLFGVGKESITGESQDEGIRPGAIAVPSHVLDSDLDEWVIQNESALAHYVMTMGQTGSEVSSHTLSGYTFLDAKRARSIDIQPSLGRFATALVELSGGLLKGLDWTNVFVAGDIDVYLYGLDSVRANEKLEHIYNVWKSNLPHDDAQVIVVRNSHTIAFFSAYPTKRVQIILKLVRNPKEVLLNFDLDVCAMG
ncbi:hypothetical protein BS47DRAFT_1480976 [Hydnum rufescens UP504]|uniref:Uncharacterized protein n=1 Tax=Hydnum rufescens UP504 TaxID=1448309 RepID=A0A9P6BAY4_9AGAM|nr:hypothetical protein BS47DRAFT_1480976 [Hydnum rufescens UP504]